MAADVVRRRIGRASAVDTLQRARLAGLPALFILRCYRPRGKGRVHSTFQPRSGRSGMSISIRSPFSTIPINPGPRRLWVRHGNGQPRVPSEKATSADQSALLRPSPSGFQIGWSGTGHFPAFPGPPAWPLASGSRQTRQPATYRANTADSVSWLCEHRRTANSDTVIHPRSQSPCLRCRAHRQTAILG